MLVPTLLPFSLRYAVWAFVAILTVDCGARDADRAAPRDSSTVDTQVVLKIDALEISAYAVEKNLAQFKRSFPEGTASLASGVRTWFELYLARQVMIAEALREDFAQRPKVVTTVETMEEYQLAQTEQVEAAPTDVDLRAAYNQIQATANGPKTSFETMRPELERRLVQQQREKTRRARRTEILQTVHITLEAEIAKELINRIHMAPPRTSTITSELVGPLDAQPLATYRRDGATVILTVEKWRSRWNAQFVRALPANREQLQSSIEDLVVTESEALAARRSGLDRESRFIEDRRNFLYYQTLDLFEKEVLLPRVEITPDETEAYYKDHLTEFSKPTRARGKLLHFSDLSSALGWIHTRDDTTASVTEDIEVSKQLPIRGAERFTELILYAEDQKPCGPIRTSSDVVIFLKQTTGITQSPYLEVENLIRSKLAQLKLPALEARLAREWASRYVIDDKLRPENFGILGVINKPWAGSTSK